jgi:hypothetical protein
MEKSRMAGRIFMKFVLNFMPFETNPTLTLSFSKIDSTNVADVQSCEGGTMMT